MCNPKESTVKVCHIEIVKKALSKKSDCVFFVT